MAQCNSVLENAVVLLLAHVPIVQFFCIKLLMFFFFGDNVYQL